MNGVDPTGRWHTETDWAALDACAMAGIDCGFLAIHTVPDPGDACGIGAVYGLDGRTCVVVCDAACFQRIADDLNQAAYVEACVNQGNLIGLDGSCQKPWAPGDACGANGIRGLDPSVCVERQEPGTSCGWNGVSAITGLDGLTCVITENLWTPTDPCQIDSSLCGAGASDDWWTPTDPCQVDSSLCGAGASTQWWTPASGCDVDSSLCTPDQPVQNDGGCSGFFGCLDAAWDATGGKAVTYVDEHKTEVAITAAVVLAVGCAATVACGAAVLGAVNAAGAAGAYATSAVLVAGSGGAVAWSVAAPEPDIPAVVHGNSLQSTKPAYLYQLFKQDGEYLKTGITQDPSQRYSSVFMSDKYMNIINVGTRANMVELERKIVEIDPGPLNLERWAGVGR